MEDELAQVLVNTQSASQPIRHQAELTLNQAKSNPAFPLSLAKIAAHESVEVPVRQSALSSLRQFIEKNWNPDALESELPVPITDDTRAQLRRILLDISLNQENRKVKNGASYIVGKIATHDIPDRWPDLLPSLLGLIPTGGDTQVHGALKIIADIVDESLSEEQFFSMARDIVKALIAVALNENRPLPLRALAVSIFRGCFDLMDIVKDDHADDVKGFGQEILVELTPLFLQVLKTTLPEEPIPESTQPQAWNGIISLKLQVLKTLVKIKKTLPNLIISQSAEFFSIVWAELLVLQPAHRGLYIENEIQGRSEDVDSLPYTLDYLILEELELIHQFLRAPPVFSQLESQIKAQAPGQVTPWVLEILNSLVAYSRITQEEEALWDIDCSLYLAEETSVSANYTSRIASGDLLIKLGESFPQQMLDGLFAYTNTLFSADAATADWRSQEAALYLFNMLANDFHDMDKPIPEAVSRSYVDLVDFATSQPETPLLRARGYLVGGVLTLGFQTPPHFVARVLESVNHDDSEVVQVACIKAIQDLALATRITPDVQVPTIATISRYMQSKDPSELEEADELLVTLVESLRRLVRIDPRVALSTEVQPSDLLFTLARYGANNFQVTMIVCETFEEIVKSLSDATSYSALSSNVLRTITSAFDVANLTQDDPLVTVAVEILAVLIEHGTEPLPPGFVAAVLPKLKRLLMESNEGEVLRPGAECVKFLLMHDHHQVFAWHSESGQTGLDICLHIIDRLLGVSIEDTSASEVGGLAAELVEKAGHERLGPYLPQLLGAVANRLSTAEAAQFIQSLILVFARLSLVGAQDVVEFLSQIQINGHSGLQVVLSKWLENSVNFAGYDEIRQNVIALSKLYSLNDPRLAQTMVKGDLIVPNSDQIMTRSRAKLNPDQYTIIPASLKIIKVLIEELLSASGIQSAAGAASSAAAAATADFLDDDGDDDWVDETETIDLSLGSTKAALMSMVEGIGLRQRDDETQAYLSDFFVRAAQDNTANFQEWYKMLSEEEHQKLSQLTSTAGS